MRRFALPPCAFLLALAAFSAIPAGAAEVARFDDGIWQGAAVLEDGTGQFKYCYANVGYKTGSVLDVMVFPDYSWFVTFKRPSASFRKDQDLDVSLSFDRGDWWDLGGVAIAADSVTIDMGTNARLVDLFRRSGQVELDDGRNVTAFRLDGSDRAMGRVGDCVRTQLALGGGRAPATNPSPGGSASASAGGNAANAAGKGGGGREAKKPGAIYDGTGIIVSAAGHIVTNEHVAGECKTITVQKPGFPVIKGELVASDVTNDLALIKAATAFTDPEIARIARRNAPAGEQIAVYGFPLAGALTSTGNIVSGNVSAVAGLGDDINHLQITAPVQPGNSGGPLLNYRAAVVGVIQSRIDDMFVLNATGTVPQNVNFAIKMSVLANFLDVHSVDYLAAGDTDPTLDLTGVAEAAKKFTVKVVCTT